MGEYSTKDMTTPPVVDYTYPISSGTRITLPLPDDFHHHFRDGTACTDVLGHASERFGRAIVMPNLKPPVTTTDMALTYRTHLLASVPPPDRSSSSSSFVPLMTLYLTDKTTPDEIRKAHATKHIYACKYYPMGVTTNSEAGVTNIRNIYPALHAMAECGLLLLIHSEVSTPSIDIYDRESVFIDTIVKPLVADMPATLKIVLEHISTCEAVEYVTHVAPANVAATITCHHLLYNRNDMFVGGIRPHLYCLPILKRETHRLALLHAATSGSSKFFAGTDSAPHTIASKESWCGCAGAYTAHAAVELYIEAFESVNALDKLEGFLCHYGADYYGIPRNTKTMITLEKKSWTVPSVYKFGNGVVRPLRAGETVAWSIVGESSSS